MGQTAHYPHHVAIIMDGNGRWAAQRDLPRTSGHAAGETAILATVDAATDAGVKWLTLFAFSTENWGRPPDEVAYLMDFNRRLISTHGENFRRAGIRIRYLGQDKWPVANDLAEAMRDLSSLTAANTRLNLTFAFNYGGRSEIVEAMRKLARAGTDADQITEATIAAALQYPDMPDPDLLIRTAGEYRLSNFLLWESAYTELVFLEVLWPDFREAHFRLALDEYASRERRFGVL